MPEDLALDFSDPNCKPYFLWSEDLTVAELREILKGARGEDLRLQYMGRILRECRLQDVWKFLRPQDIAEHWDSLQRRLGRSRKMWTYLLDVWTRNDYLKR